MIFDTVTVWFRDHSFFEVTFGVEVEGILPPLKMYRTGSEAETEPVFAI